MTSLKDSMEGFGLESLVAACHLDWSLPVPDDADDPGMESSDPAGPESSDEPTLPTSAPIVLTAPSTSREKGRARTQHTRTKRVVNSSRDPVAAAQPPVPISAEFTY